ncbi:hypothetical protein [Luteibacter sp.]|uniref:hypothetical protein n=1 Tax=Luteibacter sp. TaxID=1886636 RepID=UPI003F813169
MRQLRLAIVAATLALPGLASAANALPNTTAEEAGRAAGFASLLCGTPGSRVDAFRQALDRFVPGTSTSADFIRGEAASRQLYTRTSTTNNGDTAELRQTYCGEVNDTFSRVLTTPAP